MHRADHGRHRTRSSRTHGARPGFAPTRARHRTSATTPPPTAARRCPSPRRPAPTPRGVRRPRHGRAPILGRDERRRVDRVSGLGRQAFGATGYQGQQPAPSRRNCPRAGDRRGPATAPADSSAARTWSPRCGTPPTRSSCCAGSGAAQKRPHAIGVGAALTGSRAVVSGRPGPPFDGPQTARQPLRPERDQPLCDLGLSMLTCCFCSGIVHQGPGWSRRGCFVWPPVWPSLLCE